MQDTVLKQFKTSNYLIPRWLDLNNLGWAQEANMFFPHFEYSTVWFYKWLGTPNVSKIFKDFNLEEFGKLISSLFSKSETLVQYCE